MATIPPIRKLYLEDYASQKSWIGPLLTTVNLFMTTVVEALTKELTLAANSTSDIRKVTLSSVPTPTASTFITWGRSVPPVAIVVGNVGLLSGAYTTISAAIQVQWNMDPSGKSIQITNVVGITPTSAVPYNLTLICIAG